MGGHPGDLHSSGGVVIHSFFQFTGAPRRNARTATLVTCCMLAALALAAPAANAGDLLLLDSEQADGLGEPGLRLRLRRRRAAPGRRHHDHRRRRSTSAPTQACAPASSRASDNNSCTAGRSLTLRSAGTLAIEPGIDLTGAERRDPQRRRRSCSRATRSRSAATSTRPAAAAALGRRDDRSPGPRQRRRDHRLRRAVVDHRGGRAVNVGGDVQTEGTTASPAPTPCACRAARPVTIASSGGDVAVRGNVTTWGRDAPGRGPVAGGGGAPIASVGRDVRVGERRHDRRQQRRRRRRPRARSASPRAAPARARPPRRRRGANSDPSQAAPARHRERRRPARAGRRRRRSAAAARSLGGSPAAGIDVAGATVTIGTLSPRGANATERRARRATAAPAAASRAQQRATLARRDRRPTAATAPAGARGGHGGAVA